MSHTDWKVKHGEIMKREHRKSIHMDDLVRNRCNDSVRERFFRPAYGKIGERREEFYDN